MSQLKVLIADDSAVYRNQIQMAVSAHPRVQIVAAVANGRLAIDRIVKDSPDLLILDFEMPEMNGPQTLLEIARLGLKCKVLMFCAASKRGAETALESMKLGASDFITKPDGSDTDDPRNGPTAKIRALLLPRINALFPTNVPSGPLVAKKVMPPAFPRMIWEAFRPRIVVIGASTGGPTAIEKVFSTLQTPVQCPILIAQHMPPIFTATFAERLAKLTGMTAHEAKHGEALQANHIYVAPGDYHMRLQGSKDRPFISLDQGPHINSVRPAVDPLFQTASEIFREKCLGIVLTGMGEDGCAGSIAIKERGGAILIQDQASSVVFGMPGAVYSAGAYDKIETPSEITNLLNEKIGPDALVRIGRVAGDK